MFYSGNILIDLLLNFFFAIPEMLTMLINGVMMLFGIHVEAMGIIQIFLSVITVVLYVISVIQLAVGVRSGRLV